MTLAGGGSPWVLVPLGALAAAYAVLGVPALAGDRPLHAWAYVVLAAALLAATVLVHPSGLVLFSCLYAHAFGMLGRLPRSVAGAGVISLGGALALAAREGFTAAAVGGATVTGLVSWVTAVALGTFIASLVRESERRAELVHQLTAAQDQLATAHHAAGAAAERERLAREIHDTLAQGLTSIVVLARAVEAGLPPEAGAGVRERLALLEETAEDNLAEARALVAASPPAELAGGGLVAALDRATARTGREAGLAAVFRVAGAPRALPAAHDVVLLRVAQEALANVAKHARAHRVDVTLGYDEPTTLTVADDGRGLGADATSSGFGLAGMRTRVEQAGGRLHVESGPSGTTVRVVLP